jgi:hypothetical protein
MAKKNLEKSESTAFLDSQADSLLGDEMPEMMDVQAGRNAGDDDEDAEQDGSDEVPEAEKDEAGEESTDSDDAAEPDEDDSAPEETDVDADNGEAKPSKPKIVTSQSKEIAKLVELKRENKVLAARLKELDAAEAKKQQEAQVATLTQQYIAKGYDEDVAADTATREVRMSSIEQKLERQDFREANEEIFTQYPQAKKDIDVIMKKCKAAEMTAEEVCRGLYGIEPAADRRARESFTGSGKAKDSDFKVANANRTAAKPEGNVGLSPDQAAKKAYYERTFRDGKPMSNKEWLTKLKNYA